MPCVQVGRIHNLYTPSLHHQARLPRVRALDKEARDRQYSDLAPSPWESVPLLQGEESPDQLEAPPLQGWVRMAAWGRRVPSQYYLPEQRDDPRDPNPAPRSTIGTRRPLAPKCQIVVSFCIKNRIKKDCYLSQPQDWHPLHTQEKQAHRKVSKFTASRIAPSAHPHPLWKTASIQTQQL